MAYSIYSMSDTQHIRFALFLDRDHPHQWPFLQYDWESTFPSGHSVPKLFSLRYDILLSPNAQQKHETKKSEK